MLEIQLSKSVIVTINLDTSKERIKWYMASRNEECIPQVTSPSPGEFADVSKGYVSCLHNVLRQVDFYMSYQKCAEFLQNQAPNAGDLVWMNDINKEDNTHSISGKEDEGIVSYFLIIMVSCFLF
jgi:hypothetical protein